MTDTLKPAELDLEAMKKVALDNMTDQWADERGWKSLLAAANFGSAFDPPTVLSLLTRIEALEAERDELRAFVAGDLRANLVEQGQRVAEALPWKARAFSAEAQRDRMREALERLLPAAKLLQANSEGCAVNHYGEDFGLHGMPGFLIDTAKDIEAARAALSQGTAGSRGAGE